MLGDKKILITGAGSGIGREIAIEAARQGATQVVVTDVNAATLEETAALVREEGGQVHPVTADLRDSAAVRDLVETAAERAGGLDTLVNNAGVMENLFTEAANVNVVDLPEDVWDAVMDVNLKAVWLATKHAAPHLRASTNGPSVVNAASVAGMTGYGAPAYCASKGGVIQLTRSSALALSPDVRVNCFAPGSFRTPMAERTIAVADDPVAQERFMRGPHLLDRLGEVAEVARAVCFLASDAASFITGVNLPVDGGTTAWRGLRP